MFGVIPTKLLLICWPWAPPTAEAPATLLPGFSMVDNDVKAPLDEVPALVFAAVETTAGSIGIRGGCDTGPGC